MSPRFLERPYYRRKLPHLQNGTRLISVAMSTCARWILPEDARSIVLEHIRRQHEKRMFLYAAVVMPDHVHMLFQPLADGQGRTCALAEIMDSIRGPSAHAINKALGRKGRVWQEEYFDRLLRHGEFLKTLEYLCQNPVRCGLVRSEEEYPWLWVEPVY